MKWYRSLQGLRNVAVVATLCSIVLAVADRGVVAGEKTTLAVEVTCDRRDYSLTDEIRLDVHIANSSLLAPLTIYGRLLWGYVGGLTLHVSDGSKREIAPKEYDDGMVIPGTLEDRNAFVVLAPYHYLGTTRIQRLSSLVEKPGTYFIRVVYRSPIPMEFGMGPSFWASERGVVSSKEIEIHVSDVPASGEGAR